MQNNDATPFNFGQAVEAVRAGTTDASEAADRLVAQLDDDERLWLLDGDVPKLKVVTLPKMIKAGPIASGAIPRLGMPGLLFSDGPRGVVMGASTAFPVTMARAASWDPELEQQVGRAMGLEGRAQGANYSGAVCVNLLRHPAWGRAQECYGEDPVLIGRMGAALTLGLRENVMACVKHFALNSMENARFTVDVKVDPRALHEVYLPHFKTVVDAGVDSVMSAYNSVNGEWAGENTPLLSHILRDEWGFRGTVTSDWVWGLHDPVKSLEAGLDVEMPLRLLRARTLPKALRDGVISRGLVAKAAHRIIATHLRHAAQRKPAEPSRSVLACAEHRALARLVAGRGAVLLKNDAVAGTPLLPLDASALTRLAIIGRLASEANTGDHGSSLVAPPSTCSPLEGLRDALPDVEILHADGSDVAAACRLAAQADAVVVIAGMTHDDEGERVINDNIDGTAIFGFPFSLRPVQWLLKKLTDNSGNQFGRGGDRASLTLKPDEEALIAVVAAANPRTAVVIIGGSAILTEAWRHAVPAILLAWYPGMEGGHAIADVLLGRREPGGRLPFAIPTNAAHLPFFDAAAASITYDAWWGQRLLDRDGHAAAFRLGHGLGYTRFETECMTHRVDDTAQTAVVRVRNIGARDGATVVQVYAFDAAATRPIAQLIGFQRLALAKGDTADIEIALVLTPLHTRDPDTHRWSRRSGDWRICAAQASPEPASLMRDDTHAAVWGEAGAH
uniref:beta-glucosidase family protein n=1 Tax=uncultured Sphingomonas sp. TaxID=158754 RepID=UPI0035C9D247